MNKTAVVCTGIVSIAALEIVNMVYCKVDGAVLSSVVAVIAGLVGLALGKKIKV
jgi:hypothetical protein